MPRSSIFKLTVWCLCLFALMSMRQATFATEVDGASSGTITQQSTSDSTQATKAEPRSAAQTEPLKGEVEHSETLPALPEEARSVPVDSNLQALTPDNIWARIPAWYAGTWHQESETMTYLYSFEARKQIPVANAILKNEATRTYGMQKDKNGQIWDFLKVPFSYKANVDGGVSYIKLLRIDSLPSGDSEVVRRILGMDTTLVGEVVITHQKENINKMNPLDDGVVHVVGSMKVFDADGQPQFLKRSELIMHRVKPYEQIDTMDGLDLKKLFVEFLNKSGQADLIPSVM